MSSEQLFDRLTPQFSLTEADLQEQTSSGKFRARHNLAWAVYTLGKAGLLRSPSRGQRQITDAGRKFLATHTWVIEEKDLRLLASERKQLAGEGEDTVSVEPTSTDDNIGLETDAGVAPDEQLEASYQQLQAKLADDLLEGIMGISPYGFERLLVDFLVKMGYGKGEAVGRSGDGGN